jgi:hypothetical protein
MNHRAAIYSVRIHPRYHPNELLPLGDVDGAGLRLTDLLAAALDHLDESYESRTLRFDTVLPTGVSEVGATVKIGERGLESSIDRPGEEPFHRLPPHTEHVRAVVLAQLPPTHDRGFMALHVPFRRGYKMLLDRHLATYTKNNHDDYVLQIDPIVPHNVLRQAIDSNGIRTVRLLGHASDRFQDATKWIEEDDFNYVELAIHPKKLARILPGPLRDFLDNPDAHRADLYEFADMQFDEVKVEVELPNGQVRTFNIERPERGHPVTVDLPTLERADDTYPPDGEILEAVRAAVESVAPAT